MYIDHIYIYGHIHVYIYLYIYMSFYVIYVYIINVQTILKCDKYTRIQTENKVFGTPWWQERPEKNIRACHFWEDPISLVHHHLPRDIWGLYNLMWMGPVFIHPLSL
jgi:hypothetical protein